MEEITFISPPHAISMWRCGLQRLVSLARFWDTDMRCNDWLGVGALGANSLTLSITAHDSRCVRRQIAGHVIFWPR